MVILRISPGMANQMLEYAAGYELAKKLDTELVLDLSQHVYSVWPYMLDFFNIPISKKIFYTYDSNKTSHGKNEGIRMDLFQNPLILKQEEIEEDSPYEQVIYSGKLSDEIINAHLQGRDIYLNGYFFDDKFHNDYWDIVTSFFTSYEEFEDLKELLCEIEACTSVAIHVRRGDMLFASWATTMKDNYYLAALEFIKTIYPNSMFYIFSDDKEYVKELFGYNNNIKYVDFSGFYESDIKEFIALSRCKHHILSNSSTFSSLASRLAGHKNHYIIYQGSMNEVGGLLKEVESEIEKGIIRDIEFDTRTLYLANPIIEKYYQKYATYKKKCNGTLNNEGDRIEKVVDLMEKLFQSQRYDRFIELANEVYPYKYQDRKFRDEYVYSLREEGYEEETLMEASYEDRKNIVINIFSHNQNNIYSKTTREMQLANILGHLGFCVNYFTDDEQETSLAYINKSKNSFFASANGVRYMFKCCLYKDKICIDEDKEYYYLDFDSFNFGDVDTRIKLVEVSSLYNVEYKIETERIKWGSAFRFEIGLLNIAKEICNKINNYSV